MPTWGELLEELNTLRIRAASPGGQQQQGGPSPTDRLRRKYLKLLSEHTKRATIYYGTSWLAGPPVMGDLGSVALHDVQGFMEAVSNIDEKELDLIITSPGGDADAAESIMACLRTRFEHMRAVVPVAAMSAATMMALSCDEIVMGTHSQLGPIDPQITIHTPEGNRSSPAYAVIEQFELAKKECQDPQNIGAWYPVLRDLSPGLIVQCNQAIERSKQFVADQLRTYMLNDKPETADLVANLFADFPNFISHGRPIRIDQIRDQGLAVVALEDDQKLQDLTLSVHHAAQLTFGESNAVKMIENHKGRSFIGMGIKTLPAEET